MTSPTTKGFSVLDMSFTILSNMSLTLRRSSSSARLRSATSSLLGFFLLLRDFFGTGGSALIWKGLPRRS